MFVSKYFGTQMFVGFVANVFIVNVRVLQHSLVLPSRSADC